MHGQRSKWCTKVHARGVRIKVILGASCHSKRKEKWLTVCAISHPRYMRLARASSIILLMSSTVSLRAKVVPAAKPSALLRSTCFRQSMRLVSICLY